MAKKEENKVVLERTYNIPLRKGFQTAPMYRRAKKALLVLKTFLSKHMKSDNVKIGKYLNLEIWKRGITNPPHHVKVIVKKYDSGVVEAELESAAALIKKAEAKKAKKAKPAKPKKQAKASGAKEEKAKPESKPVEDKKEAPKKESKASEEKELKDALKGE